MVTSEMRQPIHNGVKLPRQLLEKIGISGKDMNGFRLNPITNRSPDDPSGSRTFRNGPSARKDRRKTLREQKKSKNAAQISRVLVKSSVVKRNRKNSEGQEAVHEHEHGRSERPKSILKSKGNGTVSSLPSKEKSLPQSASLPSKAPRENRAHLSADDAEIAALEKALGVKGDGVLPKSFVDDGLDLLLEDVEDSPVKSDAPRSKRKHPGDEEWLHKKRQKATRPGPSVNGAWEDFTSEGSTDGSTNSDSSDEGQLIDGDDESGLVDSFTEHSSLPQIHASKKRENPYKPPVVFSMDQNPPKYIPPSLRAKDPSATEDLTRLRRQLQGLLNRLSEANLVSILREVESLYRNNPRQHVSSILLDLVIGLLCDKTSLQDTFIILHAGFIAAIYKVFGTDFGAQAIQKIDNAFLEYYESEKKDGSNGRRSANLVSLLAQLYNFQVISCNLIYDFIRLFLEEITETSAELVLKVMRSKIELSYIFERTRHSNSKT
jgi:nucleolar MIF4G domain-containing protein 1